MFNGVMYNVNKVPMVNFEELDEIFYIPSSTRYR